MSLLQITALIIVTSLLAVAWWWLFRPKKGISTEIPPEWRDILEKFVAFYRELSSGDRIRFERDVQQFLRDVAITGVGTEIDETDKLLVASSAVIPIFRFPSWRYHNLNEVLIYPGAFNEEYETSGSEVRNILGIVGEGSMQRMMILSRPSLRDGFTNDGSKQNVGIHEFVHLLDKADGTTDGIPELFLSKPYIIPWIKVMHKEIQAMQTGNSDINVYGSKNEAEFLSVVSEYFFNQPDKLQEQHPELYALLEHLYC
ncbi:MAG: M90 family metallopeptidase [Saprospiraceae bacterium]